MHRDRDSERHVTRRVPAPTPHQLTSNDVFTEGASTQGWRAKRGEKERVPGRISL